MDFLYKLLRKLLSIKVYNLIRFSLLGRSKNYYRHETYKNIFNHYQDNCLEFKNKTVLEIGSGLQLYTTSYFFKAGAKKVILVEPLLNKEKLDKSFQNLPQSLKENINQNRIEYYNSLDLVPSKYNSKIDIICSHFVLEHFRKLESYFQNIFRLLGSNGLAYSKVDLTDHTYHIFDSRKITRWIWDKRKLHHLQYSDKLFKLINDPRIYINRLLLPRYLELAKQYSLKVERIVTEKYMKVNIHQDVLVKFNFKKDNGVFICYFMLTLKKTN